MSASENQIVVCQPNETARLDVRMKCRQCENVASGQFQKARGCAVSMNERTGGVRERMHAARTAARAENWDKSIYSRLDSATDAAQLALMADEIKRKVDQTVWGIRKRKGWK